MEGILNLSTILTVVGILVVLKNNVVQVLKKVTWGKLPTNILAIIVSMALTLVVFFAYCQIKAIAVVWYWSSPLSLWVSWWTMRRCSASIN